jgi:ribosomal protein S18 acetylase RimI-like enzyme
MSIQIRKLDAHETPQASPVIAEAMMVEPGFAAVLPDENVRRRVLISRMKDSIETAMSHDAVFAATDEETGKILGVAIWGPPGAYPPAEDGATDNEVPSYLADVDRQVIEGLQAFDDNCNRHFPDEPVWYLKLLGVDPEGQGRGIGSTLLRESLRELDEDRFPAYLETGTERNVRFYERFGFEVRKAEVQLAPGSTPHWTMIRPARVPAMA